MKTYEDPAFYYVEINEEEIVTTSGCKNDTVCTSDNMCNYDWDVFD